MIIVAAVDDRNGMMFNRRRQSQDRTLRDRLLRLTAGGRLWMNHASVRQFRDCEAPQINVDDSFLSKAADGDFCFVEDAAVAPYARRIEEIILFKWNRKYPGDRYLDIDLRPPEWRLVSTEDFPGASHEKITMEVYRR